MRAGSALPQVYNMDSLPKPQGRGFTEPWEWNKGGGQRSKTAHPRTQPVGMSQGLFLFSKQWRDKLSAEGEVAAHQQQPPRLVSES